MQWCMLTISYVARPVRHRRPRVTIGRPRSLPGIQGASRRLASFGIIAITTWMCELCPNTIKRTITYMVHGNEIALTRTYRDAVKHLSCCTFFCIYPCVSLSPAALCESVFFGTCLRAVPRGNPRSPLLRCAKRTRRIQCAHGIVLACRPGVFAGIAQAPQLDSGLQPPAQARPAKHGCFYVRRLCGVPLYGIPGRSDLLESLLSVNVAMSLSPCSTTS